MIAVVSLRIYVLAYMLKSMGLDEWIIIFSAVSFDRICHLIDNIDSLQICSIIYNGLFRT